MGAPADLAAFCTAEHPRLVGAMTLYTGDRLLAEEIAQEALVRVCERWSRVRDMSAPGAWVHRVAMNLAKSRFRRRALERRVSARLQQVELGVEDDATDSMVVRDAVRQLVPRQREAVVLRHFLGMSIEEASEVMQVSSGALRSLTHRAAGRLEELLVDRESGVRHAG